MKKLIEFISVSKKFKNHEVLKNVSLAINEREIFGIIGVSGAGKTTLLRTLIGYYNIDSGSIFYDGKKISKQKKLLSRIVGFASQEGCFYDKLTVKENLFFYGSLFGVPLKTIKRNSKMLLELLELEDAENINAKKLSGGMKRRLDIACSMIHNPKILILDEPTSGLDPVLRKHMWRLIKKINNLGTTIIISSHLLSEIENLCSRIAIINDGHILEIGSASYLKERYSRNEEIHLETFPANYDIIIDRLKKEDLPISYYSLQEHKLVIYSTKAEMVLHKIIHLLEDLNETLLDVDVNKPSLAEVFEALTKKPEKILKMNSYHLIKTNIKKALDHGYSREILESKLINKGIKKNVIEKIFGEIN